RRRRPRPFRARRPRDWSERRPHRPATTRASELPPMTRVDGRTQVYAVLGHPVDHSRSPEIQNAAFRFAGMNAVYVALEVPPPRFQQALEGLHAARVLGLNVTAPHKEAAFSLARERTPDAEEARVANTLRWEPGGWRGHATDGSGFLAWLAELEIDIARRGGPV